jgi:hypothetical protein
MKKICLFIIVLSLVLMGCEPKITEGEVIKKTFVPEHTETYLQPIVHFNGKIATTTMIRRLHYYPDSYIIDIKGKDDENNVVTESFSVTKEEYLTYEVGMWFKYDSKKEVDK